MMTKKDFIKALATGCWFIFLTFPLMVLKVDSIEKTVEYRWINGLIVGITVFLGYLAARMVVIVKDNNAPKREIAPLHSLHLPKLKNLFQASRKQLLGSCLVFALLFPYLFSSYQTTIMVNALIYIVLGLGLNIVVGLAGLLDLGYVAFYAVGAYAYGLLNLHFDLGFWAALPIGALLGAFFGILLGFPVLRLRGDYLAIVTLGFGEIIRLVLENWGELTQGPSGISNIPGPDFFGIEKYVDPVICLYYLMIALALFTIFVVNRLQNSRIGRAWIALREDEIACQAMGIDKTRTKLTAFALGATWAGMMGVIFAAKTRFINPASFTFWESAIILCIVVLGGMGSIIGVIIAALLLVLLPEHFRAFSEYRLLVFGAALVLMMRFRPGGIIGTVRRTYSFKKQNDTESHD